MTARVLRPEQSQARKRFWGLLAACLLAQGCGEGQSAKTTASNRPGTAQQEMIEDLHQYHDMVVAGWAYSRTKREFQGVDIAGARDRLVRRVNARTTPSQFAELLQEFAATLEEGHSQVLDLSSLRPAPTRTWPIGFGSVQEGVIVVNLNWLRDNPGVQLGDRLVKVNGEPIDSLVRRRMQVTSASTEGSRRILAIDAMHRTEDQTVRFSLERRDGELLEVQLPCLAHPVDFRFRERNAFCEHAELGHGIHSIRVPQFTWNETAFSQASTDGERDAALAEAKSQLDAVFSQAEKARGLILDLRGNAGGYELLSSYVAEHLVPGDFLYYTQTRRDSPLVRSLKAYEGLPADSFGVPAPVRPRHWAGFRHFDGTPFGGRLVVLIDRRCFSTTDNLCAFLRDSRPETRFVGQPTGGGTGEPMVLGTLAHSKVSVQFCVSMIHSPRGRLIEGVGTTPDILVAPSRDDLLQRRDPVLEAAMQMFENW